MASANEERLLDYLKRVTYELHQTQERLREVERKGQEPIAIIAMACRYPGGVRTPEELWQLLRDGRDAISPFPEDRGWDVDALYDPDPDAKGKSYVREGGFLLDGDRFDPAFFGVSPREAITIDPQQRLLLETSWEAFERAGIDPTSLQGSPTGVFIGAIDQGYSACLLQAPAALEGHIALGSTCSVASGRIAYTLGLEGPAVSVDTACSASLVALHLASQALRLGECSLALAGGVTVMPTPLTFIEFSRQRALAKNGRCKAFSAQADGTAWAEGVGLLLLERLSDAQRNGHPILALLRGSAVNQDGKSQGLTAPNGPAQQRVIRQALDSAKLSPSDIDAVEAHGTGTTLGDPIEAQALLATYGKGHASDRPLWLGSIKSNLGHTQAAAGVAGVIKMVLAMQHGLLPKTLYAETPSPHVDWSTGALRLLGEPTPWPANGRPRRAAVSSFGISGTNAHVLLEEAPSVDAVGQAETAAPLPPALPLVLSARTEPALRAQAERLSAHLQVHPALCLVDIAGSLATSRAHFEHRAAIVATDRSALLDDLRALAQGSPAPHLTLGEARKPGKLALLFSGQGSQHAAMGRALYDAFPPFRRALDDTCDRLDPLLQKPLRGILFAPEGSQDASLLDQTAFTQPALFALEVALFRLLQAWGLAPDLLLGHSIGEIVAAHVAGVFSLQDACSLVASRARLMQALPPGGAMLSLQASEQEILPLLHGRDHRLAIAALNGPSSTVVAGDEDAVLELAQHFQALGRSSKRLLVSHAFHSPRLEPMLDAFRAVASSLAFHPPRIPILSNLTGSLATADQLASPDYWVRHARLPVRFLDAVRGLEAQGASTFLELGPRGSLCALADACLSDQARAHAAFLPALRSDRPEVLTLLSALGALHARGHAVDWGAFFAPLGARRVLLPTYPFQCQRYWPEAPRGHRAERASASVTSANTSGDPIASPNAAPSSLGLPDPLPPDPSSRGALYRIDWTPQLLPSATPPAGPWALLGDDDLSLPSALAEAPIHLTRYPDLQALTASLDLGQPPPEVIVVPWATPTGDLALAAHATAHRALALLQAWLASPRLASSRLALITCRALAARPGEEILALASAPLWGLVRSAQSEHSHRLLVLVDIDAREPSRRALPAAITSGEPQIALREGDMLVPRLARSAFSAGAGAGAGATKRLGDLEGTVLITGGTSPLAAVIARHLVGAHGVQHLLLASRQGRAAPGAEALAGELVAAGARVTLAACDVADREALASLLASIPPDRPLKAILHAAAVLDDGALLSLNPERVDHALRPKVDAALHLDELTQDLDVSVFVLFSSLAGVLGAPGQSNYAAANTFLDALAHHRRARGRPVTSLAWGPWAKGSDLRAHLGRADLTIAARLGVATLPTEDGLALFDAALGLSEASFIGARLDTAALDAQADTLPALLRGLVRVTARRPVIEASEASETRAPSALKQRLDALTGPARARALLDFVRAQVAAVLGLASPDDIEPDRPLRELGLDSLMGLNLRNSLEAATGLRLPATLLFDQPTSEALARRLREDLLGDEPAAPVASPVLREASASEPIAIIAMACRYPGGVRTPEELWQLLRNGSDAVSRFPEGRGWDIDALYDPDPSARGKSYVREGGFLLDADRFDPAFFGISPREAVAIDPQQRLLLETSWEAIERAGIDPASLHGSPTGVFVGISFQDYGARVFQTPEDLEGYIGLGSTASIASGRIAYTLELEGPAVSVDTACSSSLVTMHLACQALRQGECSLALAGGVCIMATPSAFIEFSRLRALAPDGRCKAFSAQADGTGFAEGVGMLLLERLSDAQRNGHPVLALLRGSAINQDGKSQGLTAPNGSAQQRVIRQALTSAQLAADDVDVVEAHGTGTALGDPIEAQALLATYGQGRSSDRPLWLGSIKSNLGHTQAAAGVASVIKLVLAMQHGLLPKTLYAETPSPHVDWSTGTLRLVTEPTLWPANGHPRRAGVSSFGISGTNAHVLLEEAPGAVPQSSPQGAPATASPPAFPLMLSARSEAALQAQAERLGAHLEAQPDLPLGDVAHALATTRTHFEHRAVIVAPDRDALLGDLHALAQGSPAPHLTLGEARRPGKLALLFTGQGSQYHRMGLALYHAFPLFRDALDSACSLLDAHLDSPLRDVLFAPDGSPQASLLHQTAFTQPALFALEVALFRLLEAWGLAPDLLLGHSVGEIVAAHLAGVFSLQDACSLVAARARLMQALPQGGAMLSLQASEQEILPLLHGRDHRLAIAALNGPSSTVVAGDEDAVLELAQHFQALGRSSKRLLVSHAFHSPRIDPMLDAFRDVASSITFHPPRIPILSNLTGSLATADQLASPDYWVRHARLPVRFLDAVRALEAHGASTFLELGPRGSLCALADACLSDQARAHAAFLPALRSDRPEVLTLLSALGAVHARGHAVDWDAFFAPLGARPALLPTYPFQRQRYWLEVPSRHSAAMISANASGLSIASPDAAPSSLGLPDPLPPDASSRGALYRIDWTPQLLPSATPPPGPWALLGDDDLSLASALTQAPIHLARYPDLQALTASLDLGQPPPEVIVVPWATPAGDLALAAHATAHRALALLQAWLASPRLASSRLALITCRALAARPGEEILALASAPLWGLARSAQSEHSHRLLVLVDIDAREPSRRALPAAIISGEPQLALREGDMLVPRLARFTTSSEPAARPLDPEGTVLITGGTGALGALVASHLVARHGARHLLLASRQGPHALGALALQSALSSAGAHVTLAACDVAEPDAVRQLLASVPLEHPLTAVIHTAGVLDDGILTALTPQRLAHVLRPKVDAALILHELTHHLDLSAFVLFSSLAGVLGAPGQSNYAAANAFLDALAHHRRARGLSATSIAWGPWAERSGMTAHLGDAALTRQARHGIVALSPEEGLALFDAALKRSEASLVPARFDEAALGTLGDALPSSLRGLVHTAAGRAAFEAPSKLKQRLAALSEADRDRLLLDLVRAEVATVLGLTTSSAIKPDRPLQDLGLDSLTALELRNRLSAATGLRLPVTLLFDHPTPASLAGRLRADVLPDEATMAAPVLAEIDKLDALLASISPSDAARAGLTARLQALAAKWAGAQGGVADDSLTEKLQSAGDDELFDLIDQELGTPGEANDERG